MGHNYESVWTLKQAYNSLVTRECASVSMRNSTDSLHSLEAQQSYVKRYQHINAILKMDVDQWSVYIVIVKWLNATSLYPFHSVLVKGEFCKDTDYISGMKNQNLVKLYEFSRSLKCSCQFSDWLTDFQWM